MKKIAWIAFLAAASLAGTCLFAACAPVELELDDEPLSGDYFADYSQGKPDERVQFATDGWNNGGSFNTRWAASQVTFENGMMQLHISENPAEEPAPHEDYLGGEARSTYYYGYGDYEVMMKPSSSVGSVSTFFVCTGDYDEWPDGTKNPWDEIDIEFLGKNNSKVQFNYFANGKGGHEHWYDLGFNPFESFHRYGFRWAEDHITWFVDGEPVYRVDRKGNEAFPKTAGRILMNYWCTDPDSPGAEGWGGKYGGVDNKTADYKWVKTSAQPVNPPKGDPYPEQEGGDPHPEEVLDWSKVDALDLSFTSTDVYTVTASEDHKSAQVTYTDMAGGGYNNINMDITAAAADKSLAHLVIKNNGTAAVNVRINLISNALANEQNKAVNVSALMDGETVRTDLDWGGSFFEIAAGKEAECVIEFNGVANSLELMIDSAVDQDTATYSGDITVSGLKFAGKGTQGGEVPTGDPVALTFSGEGNENCTLTATAGADNLSATLVYHGTGDTYKPFVADCAALAAGKTAFAITIKNNRDEAVTVRVDLQGTTSVATGDKSSTDCTNQSATCTGGSGLYTDTTWGGTKVTLAAQEEVTLVITFDGTMAQGAVKNVLVFVGSADGDKTDRDADITIGTFLFG